MRLPEHSRVKQVFILTFLNSIMIYILVYSFNGSNCEVSPCHNYCLSGKCTVNDEGLPICNCNSSRTGSRCEHDVCKNHCLNDGVCLVENEKPLCQCKYSSGRRCEISLGVDEICLVYCMNRQLKLNSSLNESSCR